MPGQAHALVQDANCPDPVILDAVDQHTRAHEESAVRLRQIVAAVTALGVARSRLQGVVDFVAVDLKPGFPQCSPV